MDHLRSLKVFCTGEDQENMINRWKIDYWGRKGQYVIRYPGFVVVHVPPGSITPS